MRLLLKCQLGAPELIRDFLSFIWGCVLSVPSRPVLSCPAAPASVSLQTCSLLAAQMFLVYRPDGLRRLAVRGLGAGLATSS